MESDKILLELWNNHKWVLLLALAGLLFAICVISFGFFKAIFIFICVGIGIAAGIYMDKRVKAKRHSGGFH